MTEYVFTLSDKTPSVEIDVKETAIAQGAGQDLYDRAKRELAFTGTFEEFLTKFKGERGEKGEDGAVGAKGDTGERGIPGERGADGAKGDKGDTGERGPIGPQGPQGLVGPQGQRGETGQQGLQGLQGPVGLTGPKGDTGPKGVDGLQGPIGPQGLQGERGQEGQRGERGEQGPIGPVGPQGPIGLTGPKGADGVGIPQKLTLSGNTLTLSDGGGSVTLPATNTPAGQANEYEIHGTGMPNGRVAAPVGTTYVDSDITNGAFKWIKRAGTDNQGWEVLTGDTGWQMLTINSKLDRSYLKVRRKNDTVMYQFGGLKYGWFGIVRRGGPGYSVQPADRERNVFILGLHGIPQGFRSKFSLIGGIYNDKGTPYGTWYLGGPVDGNMLRFQFTDPVPTDRDIEDIRVSSIMYLTNDPWPTKLP
ncbi:Collagen triple helix repeat (20 copies) [Neisseria subflava]|uniref:Collagen triple helix repeat (20 copies) n=2 Tax=Neisseria subflava TaxID=28449 RepID=A0A9X9QZJ5_NEISU|nr:Collagen triple helix repeat (20 copies) [Neisseria subflava]